MADETDAAVRVQLACLGGGGFIWRIEPIAKGEIEWMQNRAV